MKKSGVVASTLFALTVASSVFAADLPLKAPAAIPVVSDWNQWYVGGEVGGKWGDDSWDTTCVQGGGAARCGTLLNALIFPGFPDGTQHHDFRTSGLRTGIYAGATFQPYANWVFGIEGDYAFSKKTDAITGIPGCSTFACALLPSTPLDDHTSITNGDDFGLRLRSGFLVTPRVLLYGTGGVAFQHVDAHMDCNGATSPACLFSHSQTDGKWLPGWTVGGGVEWKVFQNWLVRGEYRYADFGTYKPNFFVGSGDVEVFANVKVTSQIATLGVAYSFPISR